MLPLDYVLALALLSSSAPATAPTDFSNMLPGLRLPLERLAMKLEILDPREVRFIFARPEDFADDLNLLRRRYQELATAPVLADALRFPDRATVSELLAFNRSYRQHMDVRQPLELVHWRELRITVEETDRLFRIWDKVRDARCPYYYVTVRRQALKELRELIGGDCYYAGTLPPCVPLWYFRDGNGH
jgi:hypothetical protein